MEYLEGETLKQVLGRGPVALDDVLDWGCQVAEALATAHSHGVIHRDVKPENLFLVADARRPGRKQVKVLDFGIAKLQRLTMDQVHKTRTGTLLGTPLYMSPEQCLSLKDIDARSDVYSLGVILYEMVAGKRPFDGDGLFVVISRHITEQPVAPTAHRADLPPHIEAVILQALGWNYVYNDSMCSYGGTITTCTRGGDGLCYQECKTRFRLHEPDLPVHPCRTGRQASVGASAWVPDPLRARIGAVGLCPAAGGSFSRCPSPADADVGGLSPVGRGELSRPDHRLNGTIREFLPAGAISCMETEPRTSFLHRRLRPSKRHPRQRCAPHRCGSGAR
jgi:hypothetical protein